MAAMSRAFKWAFAMLVVLGASLAPALAHHSGAEYDFTRNFWVSGVVKAIRVINPHMSLTLVVLGRNGRSRTIRFEGDSVNNFYRAGWRPHMVRIGDRIKVRYNPRKDGREGGFVNGFVAANGQTVVFRLPGSARATVRAAAPAPGR